MSSRFRNELTVVPSARISVRRQGLTTTIGWNSSTSVSNSRPLQQIGDPRFSGPLPTDRFLIPGTRKDYGDGHVSTMTSPGLDGFKELLVATRQRQKEITTDIKKTKWQLRGARVVQALGWLSLACAVPKIRQRANNAVVVRRTELSTLEQNLGATRISVNFDMESEVAEPHRRMQAAFDRMALSQRSWSIETEQKIDRVKARTWANTVVSRTASKLGRFAAAQVNTDDPPLAITVLRGKSVAYFYPGFVLIDGGRESDFALVDITELEVASTATNFTETETVPTDAPVIGSTWAKANKNGSRDRRFKDNRELPILRYGSLLLSSVGGLNEAFMFSDAGASALFATTVDDLKRVLSKGRLRTGGRLGNQHLLGQPQKG